MKKLLTTALLLGIIFLVYFYRDPIIDYVSLNFIYKNDFTYEIDIKHQKEDYSFFKQTTSYKPQSQKDILNIIYSNINNGIDNFNFYCMKEYKECTNDVKNLINNNYVLSNINNFVSPYNTYTKLNVTLTSLGKINIEVDKYYNDEMIEKIDKKIDELISELITNNMSDYDKVKTIHDYIINHSIYDKEKEKYLNTDIITTYNSHLAYGPLFEGYGICSGYSDLMSLFLDKLNIPNYRISNDDHVWNLIYVNGKWLHVDTTWDDPVISSGENVLDYNYFLITTQELHQKDITKHLFDENIYIEAL